MWKIFLLFASQGTIMPPPCRRGIIAPYGGERGGLGSGRPTAGTAVSLPAAMTGAMRASLPTKLKKRPSTLYQGRKTTLPRYHPHSPGTRRTLRTLTRSPRRTLPRGKPLLQARGSRPKAPAPRGVLAAAAPSLYPPPRQGQTVQRRFHIRSNERKQYSTSAAIMQAFFRPLRAGKR